MKLAILDIGTNSIHLVLAEVEPDFSYKILDRFKDLTRLGDGTFTNRRLSAQAMARGLSVIHTLVTLARNKGFDRIEAVATSAVREARNGGDFLEAISKETGLPVRVISGREEARLIYLGVRNSMELPDRPSLIVDVGGGSVELIICHRTAMLEGHSLKLGAIRLKDLYLKGDPPRKSSLKTLQAVIERALRAALKRAPSEGFARLVAASGMAANLAEIIHLERTGRPLPKLNLATVTRKEVAHVRDRLAKASLKGRLAIPGLDPKRVDTLLPATAVLHTLMKLVDAEEVIFSDKALREGLIYDFIATHREGIRAEQEIPNIRLRSVLQLARRCHFPEQHARHVARLATRAFDQTVMLHGLGDREREWLDYAALLHDIGYLINARQHHKHAYYLIKHSDLSGFTAEEIEVIANVARYHRRALPRKDHAAFRGLSARNQAVLARLSALLRIADALDRSHFSVVQDLDVKVGHPVIMTLRTTGDPELEVWSAQQRTDLFQKLFKRPVQFVVHPAEGIL